MMGGGICWIDIDNDGWLDLFAVNSYADDDLGYWLEHGGTPRSGLFHNVKGQFTDVSRSSGADVQLRGNGCVAGDFNGDGRTTSTSPPPATTPCSGMTATATSARARALPGSPPGAGTPAPPSRT